MTKMLTNAQRTAKKIGYFVQTISKMPNDNFLYVVIAKNEIEYVVWYYNATTDGFTNGYYTFEREFAKIEFDRRRNLSVNIH